MDISNTKNNNFYIFILLLLYILFFLGSCREKERPNEIEAYQFKQNLINLYDFTKKDIDSSKVELRSKGKKIPGKLVYIDGIDSLLYTLINFEDIKDTIYLSDTIVLFIDNNEYNITNIEQKYAKTFQGTIPAFIDYKIDGVNRSGRGKLYKNK